MTIRLPLSGNYQRLAMQCVAASRHQPYGGDSNDAHIDTWTDFAVACQKLRLSFSDRGSSVTYVLHTYVREVGLEYAESPMSEFAKTCSHLISWMNWHYYTNVVRFAPPKKGSDQYELPLAGEPIHPLALRLIDTFTSGVYHG